MLQIIFNRTWVSESVYIAFRNKCIFNVFNNHNNFRKYKYFSSIYYVQLSKTPNHFRDR